MKLLGRSNSGVIFADKSKTLPKESITTIDSQTGSSQRRGSFRLQDTGLVMNQSHDELSRKQDSTRTSDLHSKVPPDEEILQEGTLWRVGTDGNWLPRRVLLTDKVCACGRTYILEFI